MSGKIMLDLENVRWAPACTIGRTCTHHVQEKMQICSLLLLFPLLLTRLCLLGSQGLIALQWYQKTDLACIAARRGHTDAVRVLSRHGLYFHGMVSVSAARGGICRA
jgi:hypothetical protein